ncbi:hypothetical protein M2164_005926 [Streptomyces sp. SAI-208]|uniref:hypothetical protein n=1 Tax=Streptomyces sp. SAI-208 TaxID=2940550 RepID=UPI00247443D3|nr:hypothetical protein [Streptomyces sp. SAI-208]MDH6610291.1 hypothetical protein [Streptomyces sp. SAI-208]
MATASTPSRQRFVVEKLGPGSYYVFDTATGLSRHPSFTRRGAQKIADRKNADHSTRESN